MVLLAGYIVRCGHHGAVPGESNSPEVQWGTLLMQHTLHDTDWSTDVALDAFQVLNDVNICCLSMRLITQ